MSRILIKATALVSAAMLVLTATADARSRKRERAPREKDTPRAAAVPSVDKRDQVIAAPGQSFNGRAYWLVAAQCGGTYFKLATIYSDVAITARVQKPNPALATRMNQQADQALKAATAYYEAAERFLMANRGLTREDAVLTFGNTAGDAGDRVSTPEAAFNAARACPAFYQVCRDAYAKMCTERALAALSPTGVPLDATASPQATPKRDDRKRGRR